MRKFYQTCRVYYERGTGNFVVDSGPMTERVEVKTLTMSGTFHTEHTEPGPPKAWLAGGKCVLQTFENTGYLSSLETFT
jgi:hypothetical protein